MGDRLTIRAAAVLGAGTMGAGIAALLAGVGIPVLLLDRVPDEPTPEERARGLDARSPAVRNRFAAEGVRRALTGNPPAFLAPRTAANIAIGNFEDDLPKLARVDWVVEAVVEDLAVKRDLFAKAAPHLPAHAVASSNTSGLSAARLSEALPEALRPRFLITHFFNPPRFLRLLELVPGPATDPGVLSGFARFAEDALGKGVVVAKDTPDFIANRIGTFAFLQVCGVLARNEAGPSELDMLTGELIGRARSATFRTADLVGLDTLLYVTRHLHEALAHDPRREAFRPPEFLARLVAEKRLGAKTGAGFYRKAEQDGRSVILELDPRTLQYRAPPPLDPRTLGPSAALPDVGARVAALIAEGGRPGRILEEHMLEVLSYAASCVPEIGEDLAAIDRALRWGFGWQLGPFQWWDALGVAALAGKLERTGREVPALVAGLLASGGTSFYRSGPPAGAGELPAREVYSPVARAHRPLPPRPRVLELGPLREAGRVRESNAEASLFDLGDGVLLVEFHSRMNVLGEGTGALLARALELAQAEARGLVVGSEGEAFSAGANLRVVMGLVEAGRFEDLDRLVRQFQQLNQALRLSPRPVVVAPRGLTLGGGCEILLHAARVVAAMESYIGLVEVGAGLIPAAGGCKELVRRLDESLPADVALDRYPLVERLMRIVGMARVAGSALEARELGFLAPTDRIVMNLDQLLAAARDAVIELDAAGWRPPQPRADILVAGRAGLAALEVGLFNLREARQMSDHDRLVGRRLAHVLCGGDVDPGTRVSEARLLDLEREAFLSLLGERKTQERIVALLKTGKPLRN